MQAKFGYYPLRISRSSSTLQAGKSKMHWLSGANICTRQAFSSGESPADCA